MPAPIVYPTRVVALLADPAHGRQRKHVRAVLRQVGSPNDAAIASPLLPCFAGEFGRTGEQQSNAVARLGNRQQEALSFRSSPAWLGQSITSCERKMGCAFKQVSLWLCCVTMVVLCNEANRMELFGPKDVPSLPYSAHVFDQRWQLHRIMIGDGHEPK